MYLGLVLRARQSGRGPHPAPAHFRAGRGCVSRLFAKVSGVELFVLQIGTVTFGNTVGFVYVQLVGISCIGDVFITFSGVAPGQGFLFRNGECKSLAWCKCLRIIDNYGLTKILWIGFFVRKIRAVYFVATRADFTYTHLLRGIGTYLQAIR